MKRLKYFIMDSLRELWDGVLKNIGAVISGFVLAGGLVVVVNRLRAVQSWIRTIPTDYVLTPALVAIIIIVVLLRINRRQKRQLIPREPSNVSSSDGSRFVTHYGVWWKIYPESEYIEDFPYCVCCNPAVKLVQTGWHPDETFKCPTTNVEYKLYSGIPRELHQALDGLYKTYFRGFPTRISETYGHEVVRLRSLLPEMDQSEMTRKLFEMEPLCRIPKEELDLIVNKFPNPMAAFHFVETHLQKYKQYMKRKGPKEKA